MLNEKRYTMLKRTSTLLKKDFKCYSNDVTNLVKLQHSDVAIWM